MKVIHLRLVAVAIAVILVLSLPQQAAAHCDTMDGPVVASARAALTTGDITPVLKWVRPADEPQIRAAFEHTLKVRNLSPEARDLADHYFFEMLVRLHRAGEGEPYTGLKPSGAEIEPGIVLADKSLETGSAETLIGLLTSGVANGVRQRLAHVQETRKHADHTVEEGRQYVAAYVDFIHYVEGLHEAIAERATHSTHEPPISDKTTH